MSDYIKQLEDQNEELRQLLCRYEPQWVQNTEPLLEKHFFFFNRCLLAMVHYNKEGEYWSGGVYSTLGAVDLTEEVPMSTSLAAAKIRAEHIVFSKRSFGVLE